MPAMLVTRPYHPNGAESLRCSPELEAVLHTLQEGRGGLALEPTNFISRALGSFQSRSKLQGLLFCFNLPKLVFYWVSKCCM